MSKKFDPLSRSQSGKTKADRPTWTFRSRSRLRFRRSDAKSFSTETGMVVSSQWCESRAKRAFDFCTAAALLMLVWPLLLVLCIVIRTTSPGPAIFRQRRVGRRGVDFTIYKLRTMRDRSIGSNRSSHADHRLTPFGPWLRKYKFDELPQLLNVVLGHMSLVGPRPKLRGHHSIDIHYRPGITGAATVAFAGEEYLLRDVCPELLEDCHQEVLNPRKLQLDLEYMATATFLSDMRLLWHTLLRRGRYTEIAELRAWLASNQIAWSMSHNRVHRSVERAAISRSG